MNNISLPKKRDANKKSGLGKLKRKILFFTGTIFLGLGFIGIVLPLLPTTPFLLLSAGCYYKSSERMHHWLLNHRIFGKYIKNYMEGKGIPVKTKLLAITVLWITVGITAFFILPMLVVQFILLVIAASVSIYLVRLPTYKG